MNFAAKDKLNHEIILFISNRAFKFPMFQSPAPKEKQKTLKPHETKFSGQ